MQQHYKESPKLRFKNNNKVDNLGKCDQGKKRNGLSKQYEELKKKLCFLKY